MLVVEHHSDVVGQGSLILHPSHFHITPPPPCLNPPPTIGQAEDKGLSKGMGGAAKSRWAVMSNRAAAVQPGERHTQDHALHYTLPFHWCHTLFLNSRLSLREQVTTEQGHDLSDQDTEGSPEAATVSSGQNMYHPTHVHCACAIVVHCADRATTHPSSLGPPLATWGNMNHTCPR